MNRYRCICVDSKWYQPVQVYKPNFMDDVVDDALNKRFGAGQALSSSSSSSLLLSSLELSDTRGYEPYIRALLGTASHFCEAIVLKLRTVPIGTALSLRILRASWTMWWKMPSASASARARHSSPLYHPFPLFLVQTLGLVGIPMRS